MVSPELNHMFAERLTVEQLKKLFSLAIDHYINTALLLDIRCRFDLAKKSQNLRTYEVSKNNSEASKLSTIIQISAVCCPELPRFIDIFKSRYII